jgi:predicted ATP-grasp superfamily ATP-dependent carboligase
MLDLSNTPLYYVTRDIDRALGLPDTDGYIIVTNSTEENKRLAGDRNDIVWIEEENILDTHELLAHPTTLETITNDANILVFKNTTQIEKICTEKGWNLLNPSATLARKVEEKITQVEWLGELASLLPPHSIKTCKEITGSDLPCIVQFNHAHTGEGTLQLQQLEQLEQLQKDFPDRPVRVTKFINGMMFTNNNVVTQNNVLIGNVNYQITGIAPYTQNPFQTIGNDWGFAAKTLSEIQVTKYHAMATAIGNKLRADGWKGLFGIDVMIEKETGKLYLIEINARQPASTTYESKLQRDKAMQLRNDNQITTFEAHIQALLGEELTNTSLIKITDGAQLFDRRTPEATVQRFEHSIVSVHNTLTI